jgi:uncharacterized membrane protein
MLTIPLVSASTLTGTVYNDDLNVEQDVLIEINSTPTQKLLSKDGEYQFDLSVGIYLLTVRKGLTSTQETVRIVKEGKFVYDVFLIPSLGEETELWSETNNDYFAEEDDSSNIVRNVVVGIIFFLTFVRIIYYRKKYGSLRLFRKKVKKESKKSIDEHKRDLDNEPGHTDKVLEIIEKHDGRISQKKLRKEMLYLSEAKISLILTELEHKGKIEKVKKGRGNVILLKD